MFTEQQEKWLQRVAELFMRYGIKALTMDDVARELGISKKTLYQFVESKDDLVNKVMEIHLTVECGRADVAAKDSSDALDEMLLVIRENLGDMHRMKSNIMFELQKYHREAWEKIQSYQRGFLYDVVRKNLERGVAEGLYRDDFDVDIVAKLHLAQTFAIFDEAWFPKPPYNSATLFREAIMHYLHGVLSEKGRQELHKRTSQPEQVRA
jgi:TetR/AcrR family transcriptional regulator, cholesterol catabolism regulator